MIEKIKGAITKVFGGLLNFILDRGEVAIKVTNIVKDVVNDSAINWVVALTPTKADDVLVAKAKRLVPEIAVKLAVAMSIADKGVLEKDPLVVSGKIFELVRNVLPEEGKSIFYRELSGLIAEVLADGVVTKDERGKIVALLQLRYHKVL